jgi:hypothetical protein
VPIRFAHERYRGRRGPACALGTIGDWSAPTRRGSLTTGQDLPRRRPQGAP